MVPHYGDEWTVLLLLWLFFSMVVLVADIRADWLLVLGFLIFIASGLLISLSNTGQLYVILGM